jgi:ATP-dependent RNA helicase DeaD
LKADVDEEQIAPFMQDISRYFEYIDKDDLIKKIVSLEFGKFLAYYADAPEIEPVHSGRDGKEKASRGKGEGRGKKPSATSEGYRKLFINLGKKDGFYPGELMQFLNKNVHGHVGVGHIDLLQTQSYFEVPEEDAERVIRYVNGQYYKNREVRCNDAAEGGRGGKGNDKTNRSARKKEVSEKPGRRERGERAEKPARRDRAERVEKEKKSGRTYKKEEWMEFLNPKGMKLKGEVPDFSEEGWAIRKPRKKK